MKRLVFCLISLGMLLSTSSMNAQESSSTNPQDFMGVVSQMDGVGFFDALGVQMSIGQEGNIKSQLQNSSNSDRAIYDNLQTCQRMYKGYDCIPHYVAEYFTANYAQYQNYYANTLSKTGDVNDAAAAFLLLTGFNSKCKSALKDYEKFMDVAQNYSEDGACKLVLDRKNSYCGAALMMLSINLAEKLKDGSILELPDKTKKNLIKAYETVTKECEKALKKNNPGYNQYVSTNNELFTLILNTLKQ